MSTWPIGEPWCVKTTGVRQSAANYILWFVKDFPFQKTLNPLLWGKFISSIIKYYFFQSFMHLFKYIFVCLSTCTHIVFPELPRRLPCWKLDTWKVSTFQLQPFLVICLFLKILKLLSKWKNCVGFFHLFITQKRFNIFFSNFTKKKNHLWAETKHGKFHHKGLIFWKAARKWKQGFIIEHSSCMLILSTLSNAFHLRISEPSSDLNIEPF